MEPGEIINTFTNVITGGNFSSLAAQLAQSGIAMYKAFVLIMIVWTGTQIALGEGFDAAKLLRFIFFIALGWAIVHQYNGGEFSLPDLVDRQAAHIVGQIDQQANTRMQVTAKALWDETIVPSQAQGVFQQVTYWLIQLFYVAMNVVAWVVIIYGLIAFKVVVLVGPLFIPWLIVPKMDWLFWGWLKALIQFGFYRIVAAAVTFIVCDAFARLLGALLEPIKARSLDAAIGYTLIISPVEISIVSIYCLVAILCMLKIPSLTAAIFAGSGGGDGGLVVAVTAGSHAIRSTFHKATVVAKTTIAARDQRHTADGAPTASGHDQGPTGPAGSSTSSFGSTPPSTDRET